MVRSSSSSGEWDWQYDWEWQSDWDWLHTWDWQVLWEQLLLLLGWSLECLFGAIRNFRCMMTKTVQVSLQVEFSTGDYRSLPPCSNVSWHHGASGRTHGSTTRSAIGTGGSACCRNRGGYSHGSGVLDHGVGTGTGARVHGVA